MRTNKFSIGGLIWVHISSIVNEIIRAILALFIISFFYENVLSAQKRKSRKNQLTKQKQANKKQRRQRFFLTKTSNRGETVYFAFLKKK